MLQTTKLQWCMTKIMFKIIKKLVTCYPFVEGSSFLTKLKRDKFTSEYLKHGRYNLIKFALI